MFGDTVDIGNFSLIPVNAYDDFLTKVQWNGTTGYDKIPLIDDGINIFPNPASSQMTVSVDNENVLYFDIIDHTGRQIFKSNSGTGNCPTCQTNVNTTGFPSGLYIINFYLTNNKVLSKKIIMNP